MHAVWFTFHIAAPNIHRREKAYYRELSDIMAGKIRRIVTGHDKQGMAIAALDGSLDLSPRGEGVETTVLWITEETPADMSGNSDRAQRATGVPPPPNGSILRVVDFLPVTGEVKGDNAAMAKEMGIDVRVTGKGKHINHPFMHRTKSIDYAIVLEGEIDMLMDDSEVHLKAGDILVQQGTNHAWVNKSGKVCRICFVLIDGVEPAVLKGRGAGH
jgi:mannose-6-phosphate isomerase-like protein (cupin superfamily)